MLKSKLITATLRTTASILLIGGIGLWSSSLSAKTVLTSKDTAQNVEATVAKTQTNVSDGIAQLVDDSTIEPTIKRPSQQPRAQDTVRYSISVDKKTDDFSSDWQVQAASQDWRNLNRGDGSAASIVRYVVWRF